MDQPLALKKPLKKKLSNWLINRRYKQELTVQEIHGADAIERESKVKHPKRNKVETLTKVLTYHLELNSVYEVLQKTHHQAYKSPRLEYVLPASSRVAFRNNKSLKDKVFRRKLKNPNKINPENYIRRSKSCLICDIIF